MRTVSAGMLVSIAKSITDPVFLFKIDFGSQFVYATSREAVPYNGDNYNTTGARLVSVDNTQAVIALPNADRSISALAFAGQIQGNSVVVYLHYDGETLGRFTGLLSSPSVSGDYNTVSLKCVSEFALGAKWPRDRLRAPTANHLPAPGTTIKLGSTNIILERDS